MSDAADTGKPDRPSLPRDGFRGQRAAAVSAPVVVMPDYGDGAASPAVEPDAHRARPRTAPAGSRAVRPKPATPRNPFDAYGERSSSRPYALRLPDAVDFVLRQMAAEERTHPLRVVDRILYEHLKKAGRLPPPGT